ncbi:Membrane fusion component of tripartite multidrug resistance system [Lysobacter capsici AZ78]|uniref:Membrane fusion component of tripartite multidrug resistance system n=1 Tax=Lysobacter capsici AZ78 TaxID=1444315 RepID=A0A108UE72_9GAMM|nr:HlyD family secretion protein [Lysobacter capsici]KWS07215.1 Membrane fusion component of tripartite multidrug resistance system [Lysobacter capsici AZ78]
MNTAVNAAGGGAVDGAAKPRWRPSRKAVIAVALAVALAIGGAAYILSPKRSVSTDNAYLQADSSIVAPKVRGLVAQVLVNHNQVVRRGDALLRIDAEEFDAKVASAGADLQDARAAVQAAQAALVSLDAEQRLAQSTVHAAQVSIRASDAQSEVAQANRRRYDNLVASGAVARQDVEQFRAAAITAQVGAQRSRAEFEVSRNQADVTRAKRSSLQAGLAQAQANVARAQAALNLALQDQRHTLIRAPIDGVVADRQIEQGDYVQPGTRVMSIVPLGALYVVANFKETQTARMMAGQRANIEVDALPGTTLHGRIDSFAPGSGSQFSLLPFEPGTGNFTKIVQRVPVRIRFDPGQPELARLRPGLSSTVSVRLDTPPTATLVSAVP